MERKAQRVRDQKILQMIQGLFEAEVAFQELSKKHQEGLLRFPDIERWVDDRGQSLLYRLKERCHSLFRFIGTGPFHKKEWLLDLAIGSIFHEAMKLRENIYQLEVYRPRYIQYKSEAGNTDYEKDYLEQFERIISRAEQGAKEGMEETRSLFRDAKAQVLDFFKASSENSYMVRFLLEHQLLLQKVYGKDGARKVFQKLFQNGLFDAYWVAGQSYLDSEHYDLSSLYFKKASKARLRNPELRSFLNFSLGMDAYYRNDYTKAIASFHKVFPLKSDGRFRKEYLRRAEEACRTIVSEIREEKGLMAARKAQAVADQIRRML